MNGQPPVQVAAEEGSWRTGLHVALKKSGLSFRELAERSGVSRRTLRRIVEGNAVPRVSTLEALAKALDLTMVLLPQAALAMQLHEPPSRERSKYSPIARLLAEHNARSREN